MENIWEIETLSDIIMFNIDYQEIGETEMLNFNGTNAITLYVGLNKTNAEKLQNGQYTEKLFAYEYLDIARRIKQSEVVVEISYDTSGLFDMLHPNAYKMVNEHIKANKLKKPEISDMQIINNILGIGKYTGVRVINVNTSDKCYPKTKTVFENVMIHYFLNPANVTILNVLEK